MYNCFATKYIQPYKMSHSIKWTSNMPKFVTKDTMYKAVHKDNNINLETIIIATSFHKKKKK